jgi:hypothetical protein
LVLAWFGAEIFIFVFGAGWGQAGRFAGVIVVGSFLGLAAQGTTSLHVYRLNHWMCAWELAQLALVAGALGAAWRMMLSPMACVVAITAAFAIANAILLGLNTVAVRRVALRANRSTAPATAAALLPKAPLGHAQE